jgi:RNA polymerase sigma-70 factor (sigma-E family)
MVSLGRVGTSRPPARDAAIAELHRLHWVGLVRLAVLMLDDLPSAEDVVQDAYAELYRKWDKLHEPEKVLSYLRSAVLNRSRSVLRRRRIARLYVPPSEPPAGSPEQAAVLDEDRREVHRAVTALPTRMREVLVLRFYFDLPYAEIAGTLGISESSARATASRGIALLGQKLKDLR